MYVSIQMTYLVLIIRQNERKVEQNLTFTDVIILKKTCADKMIRPYWNEVLTTRCLH